MFKRYRWNIVLMLFLANAINYIDRSAMSVALPILNKRFELTPFESGLILSSFFVGYALFNFVGGYLADKVGPKKVMGAAMAVWSVFCGLTAGTFNFVSLFLVRVFFGFGEGPITSTTNKTMNNWIPLKERATSVGICNGGAPVGGAISAPLVAFISLQYGWEASFVILAVVGIIWTLVWLKVAADKPEHIAAVSQAEVEEIYAGKNQPVSSGNEQKAEKVSLLSIIKQRRILCLLIGLFGYNYTLFFFLTWFPTYLVDARGLSIKEMGFAAMIPWIAGAIGQLVGSVLIDFIYRKTGKLLWSRKVVLVSCLSLAAICVGLTGLANSVMSAVILMTIGICFLYLQATTYWAIIQDIVPAERVGGTSGFIHGVANLSGILGPSITGWLVRSTGQYTTGFLLAAGLALIGAMCVAFFVTANETPQAKNKELLA